MGLLMMTGWWSVMNVGIARAREHTWQGFLLLIIVGALFASGCSGLKLLNVLRIGPEDWAMFGKDVARTHVTRDTVTLPLKVEWEADITGGVGNSSPLVIDTVLLIGNLRGELCAFSTTNGKRLGWVSLGDAIAGAPAVDAGVAFLGVSNTRESLVAFDLMDGKTRWRREYGDIEATPLLYEQKLFFGNTLGIFFCVERMNGDQEWKFEIPDNTKRKGIRSSAAAWGNTVVFGAEDGAVYALDIETGRQHWKFETGASVFASPSVAGGRVFVGNVKGDLFALDANTGARIWQELLGASIYASAAIVQDKIVIGTTGGTLFCLHAADGMKAWSTSLNGVINSSASISGDLAFVGTLKKSLFAVNVADGKILAKEAVQGRLKTSPAIANGRVYVATDDRQILSFKGAGK